MSVAYSFHFCGVRICFEVAGFIGIGEDRHRQILEACHCYNSRSLEVSFVNLSFGALHRADQSLKRVLATGVSEFASLGARRDWYCQILRRHLRRKALNILWGRKCSGALYMIVCKLQLVPE